MTDIEDIGEDMGLDPETTAQTLQFTLSLSDEQYEELEFWLGRVDELTRFSAGEALDACTVMSRLDLEHEEIIECLGPVAAYAHANDRPIDATAEQIGLVMGLSDLEADNLPGLLDLSEALCEGVSQ